MRDASKVNKGLTRLDYDAFFLSDLQHATRGHALKTRLLTQQKKSESQSVSECRNSAQDPDVSHTVGLQWDRLHVLTLKRPGPPNQRLALGSSHAPPSGAPSRVRASECSDVAFSFSTEDTGRTWYGVRTWREVFTCLPAWGMWANRDQGCDRIRGEPIAGYHRDPYPACVLGRPDA